MVSKPKTLLFSLLGILLLLIAFAPTLLSTDFGKTFLTRQIEKSLGAKVEISSLTLRWLGPQEIEGMQLKDAEKQVSIKKIKFDAPIWSLLGEQPNIGHASISQVAVQIKTEVKKATVPKAPKGKKIGKEKKFSLPFRGELDLVEGRIEVIAPGIDPILFQDLTCHILLSEAITFNAKGKTEQGSKQGSFQLQGKFDKKLDLDVAIKDLPTLGVDQILSTLNPGWKGMVVETIGPTLNLNVQAQISDEQFDMQISGASQQFAAQLQTIRKGSSIALKTPGMLSFTLSPTLSKQFLPAEFSLTENAKLTLNIKELSLPIRGAEIDFFSIAFESDLEIPKAEFGNSLAIENFQGLFSTKNLQQSLLAKVGFLALWNENPLQLSLNTTIAGIAKDTTHLTMSADSKQFRLSNAGFSITKSAITLEEPATGTIVPSDLTYAQHHLAFDGPINFTLQKFVLPLPKSENMEAAIALLLPRSLVDNSFSISTIPLELTANGFEDVRFAAPQIAITKDKKRVRLENCEGEMHYSPKEETLFAKVKAAIQDEMGMPGNLSFTGSLDKQNIAADIETHNFPLSSLEILSGKPFSKLLGPSLHLSCKVESTPQKQSLSIKGSTAAAEIDGAFLIEEGHLSLSSEKQAAKLRFSLTPEGFQTLNQWISPPLPFELTETTVLALQLSELTFPIKPDLAHTAVKGSLQIDKFSLLEKKSTQIITLRDVLLDLSHPAFNLPLTFSLSGNLVATGASSALKQKQLTISGKLDQFIGEDGSFDLKNLSTTLNADMHDFPVAFLDVLTHFLGNTTIVPSALIGPELNATAEINMQRWTGPVSLNIHAQNSRLSLKGQVNQGSLTLSEPIYGQLTMTPELSTFLLREVNPLGIKAVAAKNPFTLQVEPKGFSYPLYPFLIPKIQMPSATLEFGQISCENEGNLAVTLALLKAGKLKKEKQLKLWFTPIITHLKEGVLQCERTEILVAGTYEIATWGTIDLVKDRVDMVLGLTAQCLEKAFGIKNLPQDYVMQIPMKGKTSDVKINTTAATAKIAALMAWQHKDSLGGGLGGGLLGDLLGTLGTLPDKDNSYPPAKRPFPWDTSQEQTKKRQKESSSKKAINKKDKPLKQLLKAFR